MKITSIGGGPAGLYFAILTKKAFPDVEVTVFERNRADDTFGWGVVFSDETLDRFEVADPESFAAITSRFRRWDDIETFYRGTKTVSTGHGFAALSRKVLLQLLQDRCRALGVDLRFQAEVEDLDRLPEVRDADLVIAADGINSGIRTRYEDTFQPSLDWRRCKFTWLGTDKPLDAFTFIFEENEHGLFQVHAYPFDDGLATWIVECHEDVWRRAGLEKATEADTVAYCERLFAPYLDGHRLLTNRSLWRTFPTVSCAHWVHCEPGRNVVLLGDAAHTAHFSIGSGTKLAMEDAIVLHETFVEHGFDDIPSALQAYEDGRWVDVIKLQKAAQTSLEWFENSARYMDQDPTQLTFNLMTRSKRITYDNLASRDPELVRGVDRWFAEQAGVAEETWQASEEGAEAAPPPPVFTPFRIGALELTNRLVVSPMCQYMAADGMPEDWHLVHYGSRAIGGAGLMLTEMTDISADGRITPGCCGLYTDDQRDAWRRIVDFVHGHAPDTRFGIQLAHAGRKGSTHHPWQGADVPLTEAQGAWPTIAPSAVPFAEGWPVPKAMDRADMDRVTAGFVRATERANDAGFDLVELHMAHGYLLSSFLSPLTNHRDDDYGGGLENRLRYPLEVLRAVRTAWPAEKPIAVRITASDWMPDGSGMTAEMAVDVARALCANGCDIVDVSSGGNVPDVAPEWGRMYQVPFADRIRHEAGVPVIAVGALQGADHANTVIASGRADLAAMARPHLHDAYLSLHAAERYGQWNQRWPGAYLLGQPRQPRPNTRRP